MAMLENILRNEHSAEPVLFSAVIVGMLLAFVCGQVMAWVYMHTHTGLSYSRTYVNSLVILPILVAMVMMVLSNNLVTAFGLMALFAIVRFRNILRDTLDTCYILSSITFGMACGTGRHATAVAGLALLVLVLFYLSATAFGTRQHFDAILNVFWTRPLGELADFNNLLRRHAIHATCASQRAADGGAGTDLSYRLLLRDPSRLGDLIDEVKAFDGATRVTGLTAQDESEL